MSDEYYDEDGFRLNFEDDTSESEKQFFMRAFPNVNRISERKVHCTSCYMHIGTAPISEAVIRMHPILRVTHCRNCHTFYNSGEFDKGEDGSELYCRWCGQGGEVYCCSKCPFVFCKKCIVQNLSRACVQDISRNDNWQCFSCAPKIMWHLRAQHWALINYIEKQKKDMKDKNHTVQSINNLMKQDNTTCCVNKGLNKKTSTPTSSKKTVKRVSDVHESGAAKIPEKRTLVQVQQQSQPQQIIQPPAPKKLKTDNNEVVCTPDILSMFMNPEESASAAAAAAAGRQAVVQKPPIPAPAPVAMSSRQVVVRPAYPGTQNPVPMRMPIPNPSNLAPPPVYHTINGYKIDLHTAAQQGTYRLPNGKLIQVRKQAPTAPSPQPPVGNRNVTIAPKPPNTYYNPSNVVQNPTARVVNGNPNVHINLALQQQQQLQEQRLQQQRQQQQQQQHQQQLQQQMLQQARPQLMVQVGQPQPTIVAGQPNPALQLPTLVMLQTMVNGPHEDSPLGRSRKNFEGKLLSGVEICQHIVSKINTLTNSNPFKNIRNVRDLKELYIHVSYLLTYAIGRFKTLQDKCVDDVKKMGFTKESDFVMMGEQISNRNPDEDKSDDEGDCEIVEQNTTLITIDSEDEDDGCKKRKDQPADVQPAATETEVAVAAILADKNDADTSADPISIDEFLHVSISEGDKSLEPSSSTVSIVTDSSDKASSSVANLETDSTKEKNGNEEDDDLIEIIETVNEDVLPEKSANKDQDVEAETETVTTTTDEGQVDSIKSQETTEKVNVDENNKESSENINEKSNDKAVNDTEKSEESVETDKEEKTAELETMEVDNSEQNEGSKSEKDVVDSKEEDKIDIEKQVENNESADISETAKEESLAEMHKGGEQKNESKVENEQKMETDDSNKQCADGEVAKGEVTKPSETDDPIELDDDEDDDVTVVEPPEESKKNPTEIEDSAADQLDGINSKQSEESCPVEIMTEADSSENVVPTVEPADSTVIIVEPTKLVDNVAVVSDTTVEVVSNEVHMSREVAEEVSETIQASESPKVEEPSMIDKTADNSDLIVVSETSQVSESNIERGIGVQCTKSVEKLDDRSSPSNNHQVTTNQSTEATILDTSAVSGTIAEELEAPTGNDLLASIEDSFQKLQQMLDATESATDADVEPITTDDVDAEMIEAGPTLEPMEVDGNPAEADLENGIFEVAEEPMDESSIVKTNGTNLLGLEDGLEPIVSEENFAIFQKSINSPQTPTTSFSLAEKETATGKLEEIESIKSLDGLTVNGDC